MNLPPFLLPKGFDARTDMVTFDFENNNKIFNEIKEAMKKEKMQPKIKQADILFDLVGFMILLAHLYMSFIGIASDYIPSWFIVIFFICSRTSLAAVGHYHCHRVNDGIRDWGEALFDIQYVGASLILADGHVMVHHMYTNSHADIKRTVFTAMLDLPRMLRIPVYTI